MTRFFKWLLLLVLVFMAISVIQKKRSRNLMRDYQQTQVDRRQPQVIKPVRRDNWQPVRRTRETEERFSPLRNLYRLRDRGYGDDALSSIIVQTELIKKDRRLAWQQHDIDDCNDLVLAYVEKAVRENSSYYLRKRLVETFGQTNRSVLINRLRLVAVLLGGEKGRGGMDANFTPIREEAHRISPYVIVLVKNYITELESKMKRAGIGTEVDDEFKRFVNQLGDSYHSERGLADLGAQQRNEYAKELYALKVLLRDLNEYYGERVPESSGKQRFEIVFAEDESFRSAALEDLRERHGSMAPKALAEGFIQVGLELREHVSAYRAQGSRDGNLQVTHLQKLNEIAAAATGLYAAGREGEAPLVQARALVDLLFLEGLYSKKDRKALRAELKERLAFGKGHEEETQSFYQFISYMSGLAHAKLDETLGDAARAFTMFTPEAENYMEVQARKSALQVLSQIQQEFFKAHPSILAGKKDIHLAGEARGVVKVFNSQSDIAAYLRKDPMNGASTIWVLKSGLNMPNAASFAAIILEDPIMKASHYDGYARSRQPPIPLLQVPGAAKTYANYDGKTALLKATRTPNESVTLTEASWEPTAKPVAERKVLPAAMNGGQQLLEIDGVRRSEELREMQKQIGSKAANYAFLRSAMPMDKETGEEHIYPGFGIPFEFYVQHLRSSGADYEIANLKSLRDPSAISEALSSIQHRIKSEVIDGTLQRLIRDQLDDRLQIQHRVQEETVKLRFRSSSNAEDNKDFSGAGLYESHPAFYTYGDRESMENVSKAITQVWASLWKPEAYQAREQAGIVQESVRMGILVHPSYRKEESTGVVYYYGPNDIEIAANAGNENVQNPSIAGLTPEIHRLVDGPNELLHSSRFLLSKEEILSKKDRKQLLGLLRGVIPKFQALYPEQGITAVDVEFKVLEIPDVTGKKKDVVMLKQIRPLAQR